MAKLKRMILKKAMSFPKGTVFECIDGDTHHYVSGAFENIFGLTDNTYGSIVYFHDNDKELEKWFKFEYEEEV